jgi:molybdopterin molybdotransferase
LENRDDRDGMPMVDTACVSGITLQEAHAILRRQAKPLAGETVPIQDAGFRVLAEPVIARIDAPRGHVAAMDGFAVSDAAIRAGRRVFEIVGVTYAGQPPHPSIGSQTAVRIMTGALMPQAADRVIPFELTDARDGMVRVVGPVPEVTHVRAGGSDFKAGQILLGAGSRLDPGKLVAAAGSDQPTVRVHRRPRLRVITSGDELVPAGEAVSSHTRTPDSLTGPVMLLGEVWGAVFAGAASVPDDIDAIGKIAGSAGSDCDVLVLAGGASQGDRDLARPALESLGLDLLFSGVAIRPGRPAWYGRLGATHVLGLPGNPSAAMAVARLFLAPLLCALEGRGFDTALAWRTLPLAAPVPATGAMETFLYARRHRDCADVIVSQSASAQHPLAAADMLVRRAAGAPALLAGAAVPVLEF